MKSCACVAPVTFSQWRGMWMNRVHLRCPNQHLTSAKQLKSHMLALMAIHKGLDFVNFVIVQECSTNYIGPYAEGKLVPCNGGAISSMGALAFWCEPERGTSPAWPTNRGWVPSLPTTSKIARDIVASVTRRLGMSNSSLPDQLVTVTPATNCRSQSAASTLFLSHFDASSFNSSTTSSANQP